jgi:hypothetical protein
MDDFGCLNPPVSGWIKTGFGVWFIGMNDATNHSQTEQN